MADKPTTRASTGIEQQSTHSTGAALTGNVDMNKLYQLLMKMDVDMKTRFEGLSRQLGDVKEEIKAMKSDIDEMERGMKYLEEDMIEMKEDTIPKLRDELKCKIAEMEKARVEAELYSKKANLLFFNIPSTDRSSEDSEAVLRDILSRTNIPDSTTIQFANVHRLPTKGNTNFPKPIIAKFIKMRDRDLVLKAIINAQITIKDRKVSVAPHLPASMQTERKRLVVIRNKLKSEGKAAKIRVTGTQVQLFINDVVWKC